MAGTLEIDSPRPYSKVANGLIEALGIDPPALQKEMRRRRFLYASQGLGTGIFFDKETFGKDKLAAALVQETIPRIAARCAAE